MCGVLGHRNGASGRRRLCPGIHQDRHKLGNRRCPDSAQEAVVQALAGVPVGALLPGRGIGGVALAPPIVGMAVIVRVAVIVRIPTRNVGIDGRLGDGRGRRPVRGAVPTEARPNAREPGLDAQEREQE